MTKQHAIYLRVSTKRQDTASQEPELRRWADRRGRLALVPGHLHGHVDGPPRLPPAHEGHRVGARGYAGGLAAGPAGADGEGLTCLFEDLIRCKVNLISLKDGLDLVTPAGRLMANILAGVAAYETEVPPSASRRASRPPAIAASTGAARARCRRIKVTVEQVEAIRRLRSEGGEIAAIAQATGLSRPTIYRILGEECEGSSLPGNGGPATGVACVTRPM